MLVGWDQDCCYRTRGIVRDVCSLVLERTTQFLEGGSRYLSTLLRAETWGACRARVQHSAELCCVVVVLSPKAHVMVTSCMLCFHCIDSLPVAPIDLEPALLHSGIFSSREFN